MLRGILVLALALLCVALCPRGRACAQTTEQMLSRGSVNLSWFKDTEMDFQLVRSLGADAAGGGAVGEILTAAKGIKDGDPASWTAALAALARRMEADGEARLERGHKASAMESFMRASSYYRAAEYYGDSVAPETAELGMNCRDLFLRGMQLSTWKTESVTIPFGDDDFLPGYFISPAKGTSRRKTLVAQSGFDGTAEEMYFAVGRAALERLQRAAVRGARCARRHHLHLRAGSWADDQGGDGSLSRPAGGSPGQGGPVRGQLLRVLRPVRAAGTTGWGSDSESRHRHVRVLLRRVSPVMAMFRADLTADDPRHERRADARQLRPR